MEKAQHGRHRLEHLRQCHSWGGLCSPLPAKPTLLGGRESFGCPLAADVFLLWCVSMLYLSWFIDGHLEWQLACQVVVSMGTYDETALLSSGVGGPHRFTGVRFGMCVGVSSLELLHSNNGSGCHSADTPCMPGTGCSLSQQPWEVAPVIPAFQETAETQADTVPNTRWAKSGCPGYVYDQAAVLRQSQLH